jgi:hypothetical protein
MKKGKDAPVSSAKVLLAVVVAVLMLSCPLGALAQVSTIDLEATRSGFTEDELFFDWDNLNPGDTIAKTIKIINNHSRVVLLTMKAEIEGEYSDLLDHIMLTLTYDGDVIYEGPASGNPQPDGTGDYTGGIDLGSIPAGDVYQLEAEIFLDGNQIGNEFQGASGEIRWIFTGKFDEARQQPSRPRRPGRTPVDEPIVVEPEEPVYTPPEEPVEVPEEPPVGELPGMPKTGEGLPYPYYLAGACAIVAGIGLLRNKSKS